MAGSQPGVGSIPIGSTNGFSEGFRKNSKQGGLAHFGRASGLHPEGDRFDSGNLHTDGVRACWKAACFGSRSCRGSTPRTPTNLRM